MVSEDEQGAVEVIDREPWRTCWACGSMDNLAGETFCTNCGAALQARTYQGIRSEPNQPNPLSLINEVTDEEARTILPTIWDHFTLGERTVVLLEPADLAPAEQPLDELSTLRSGAILAHVLHSLHQQQIALGIVQPEAVGIAVNGQPRLFHVPFMRRFSAEERATVVAEDLQALAALLEELAGAERPTRRLSQEAVSDETLTVVEEPALPTVLSEVRTGAIADAIVLATRLDSLVAERTKPQPMHQRIGAASDTGMVRKHNEDSLLITNIWLNNTSLDRVGGLYIVADGMGGHAAGEIASYLAARSAAEYVLAMSLTSLIDPGRLYDQYQIDTILVKAVAQANEAVRREASTRGNDMGTTLTMALVIGDRVTIANVGDSRTYLYRAGELRRITQDHSLVMRLVELGQLTEADIYTHPQRNAVLRSLGDQQEIEVDLFTERLQPGDALLLCSDGQWEMTRDPEMANIISQHHEPQTVCHELIRAANRAGGEDNVTSIVVRFEEIDN